MNTDKFYYIYKFKYANGTIAFATLKDKSNILINKEGQPSIEGISLDDINNMKNHEKTTFENTKKILKKPNE